MKLIALIFSLFFCFLSALEIVDDGAVIRLKRGEQAVKQISLYNFSEQTESYQAELLLNTFPEKEISAPRAAMAELVNEEITLLADQKKNLTVNIKSRRELPTGRYIYTVVLRKKGAEYSVNQVAYKPIEIREIPLIIEII